ncbi:hypothetical protein MLD38_032122 [Melastoma candidum]|uniref:Uncharacterized protein n=1 Tax=Melastoma candidum TaxID=119954 RepID=A0ACB9M2R0_9MYRT|nr:hypothetical protein MLD38_032122 [Melastoma candidum]
MTRSTNSGGSSKRSGPSSSLHGSAGSGNKRRKTKSSGGGNQQTLGMAWGASSSSACRSSFRSSPFSDFGSYMSEKNRKLQEQFCAEATCSSNGQLSLNALFKGVSIFVDGLTVPSCQELRVYMLKYGGRLENYFSRHRVTHIICSNLPSSKIKNIRSFSAGLPVVKPNWIVDCIACNKLLSWVPYQLDQLSDNQPRMSNFFGLQGGLISEEPSSGKIDALPENDHSFSKCPIPKDLKLPVASRGTESRGHGAWACGEEENVDSLEDKGDLKGKAVEIAEEDSISKQTEEGGCVPQEFGDGSDNSSNAANCYTGYPGRAELIDRDTEKNSSLMGSINGSFTKPSLSTVNHCPKQSPRTSTCSDDTERSSKGHSSLGDPNFVENFFKYSRLHFIGTWRSRYRKRFSSISCRNEGVSVLQARDDDGKNIIIHIDMDCFFVSVVIRNFPELQDKPVAICHSDNPGGTAEISSANYPARDYGIKAGMFVRDAKALCPHLVIFPYNFEAYEEVADSFYDILHKHCNKVQAVSCDEAFLDMTDSSVEDPELLASLIRREIFETTGCTASAGIARNMLMARLATRNAKPNGQFHITLEMVDEYLRELPVKALPGIGYVLEDRLRQRDILTCGQLRDRSKEFLQREFGLKTGEMLWSYSRGMSTRMVGTLNESKSVGAEVNWGVRFRDSKDSKQFLSNLCKEVSSRLQGCGLQGRKFTLKIKKKRKDADEPVKYMGCGDCENLSHTTTVPTATDEVDVITRIAIQLFGSFNLDVKDIRGIGLQVSKFENADASRQARGKATIRSWLTSDSATGETSNISHHIVDRVGKGSKMQNMKEPSNELHSGSTSAASLSRGKLVGLSIDQRGSKDSCTGRGDYLDSCSHSAASNLERMEVEREGVNVLTCEAAAHISASMKTDLMPLSLSQIDSLVLQQLPEEVRKSIIQMLPAHRDQSMPAATPSNPAQNGQLQSTNQSFTNNQKSALEEDLWTGSPPLWVDKFKMRNCWVLNTFADMYGQSEETSALSRVLRHLISDISCLDENVSDWDEAILDISKLLKQYIRLKVELDIEEMFICFRLLKRLGLKSKLFQQIEKVVYPFLQASVAEHYGVVTWTVLQESNLTGRKQVWWVKLLIHKSQIYFMENIFDDLKRQCRLCKIV